MKNKLLRSKTLVRVLPKTGLCSRTQAYELIRSSRVTVNGRIVSDPDAIVAQGSRILVDGATARRIRARYILFHKPAGCVTTSKDERSRQTVYDVLGDVGDRVFPVGRLDKETEGLLLFTNDTAFGDFLTDPKNGIPRTYLATVRCCPDGADMARALRGIDIGRGERSRPSAMRVIRQGARQSVIEITLTEGRNREVRRLCEALGAPVTRLVRVSFGPFRLGDIPSGKWRELDGRICVDLYAKKK